MSARPILDELAANRRQANRLDHVVRSILDDRDDLRRELRAATTSLSELERMLSAAPTDYPQARDRAQDARIAATRAVERSEQSERARADYLRAP